MREEEREKKLREREMPRERESRDGDKHVLVGVFGFLKNK